MNEIIIAVIIVAGIGLIAGIGLAVASRLMSVPKDEKAEDPETEKIEALIANRAEAKKAKDFAAADAIRDELAAMGITIKDTRQGVQWFRG